MTSLSQGRTAAAQCGLFTYKSVPVIFEPPCMLKELKITPVSSLSYKKCVLKEKYSVWHDAYVSDLTSDGQDWTSTGKRNQIWSKCNDVK